MRWAKTWCRGWVDACPASLVELRRRNPRFRPWRNDRLWVNDDADAIVGGAVEVMRFDDFQGFVHQR